MSVEARDHYLASFARLRERAGDSDPSWLAAIREEALERFAAVGFPTTKLEDWKYTNANRIARTRFAWGEPPPPRVTRADVTGVLGDDFSGAVLAFVNGRFSPELSTRKGLPDGVAAGSLAAALAGEPARLERHLARIARFCAPSAAFAALNTAFLEDGAYVHLPRGAVLAEPIGIAFLQAQGDAPPLVHPRVLVVAEAGSQAAVVEGYAGVGDAHYFANAVTEIVVGDGAGIAHVKLQSESARAFHVAVIQATQGRDSSFTSYGVSLGAAFARNDVNTRIDAEGGEARLLGLYHTLNGQHVDHHTEIDHARPHTTSHELYKGILGGKSRGVFNGKVIVRQDAQKTSAYQANKNLLLAEEAEIDTKPQLEIHADDVRCSHGATIGCLDELALFYLRSRGIAQPDARDLLTRAFAAEITECIPLPPLRAHVEALLAARLELGRAGAEAA